MIALQSPLRVLYGRHADRYLELIHRFPLRPIRSDLDLEAAIGVIDALIDKVSLNRAEDDYLDVLSDLVEAYEDVAIPMRDVPDSEMLRFLLEQHDQTQTVLAKKTRIAESTISEVLAGKRQLTREQIVKLAKHFHVEPGVFSFSSAK